jgi:hypothetical protein
VVIHKDTKPLPTYALIAGKKPQLKEASGSEETGCRPQAASGAGGEGPVLFMSSPDRGSDEDQPWTGDDGSIQLPEHEHGGVRGGPAWMIGASVGPNAVQDETALKGNWNFDLKYSLQMMGPGIGEAGDRITIFTAIDKQLGLKLEEKQVPTPVLVVDSVNRTASENPPGVAEALPPIPLPTEFEVATIKPTDAGARAFRYQMQPGGRLVAEGTPLQFLISRAFNSNNNEQIAGVPAFAMTDRYDINAKAPSAAGAAIGPGMGPMNMDAVSPIGARAAGRSLQNEVPHRGKTSSRLRADRVEAEDEEGGSQQPYLMQEQQRARRGAAGIARVFLPEHDDGAFGRTAAEYSAGSAVAGRG